jgi:hypothetical protein
MADCTRFRCCNRAQWADDEAAANTRIGAASQGSQEASEVAALLQAAGFTTIAAADPAAAADQAPASAAGCCDQSRSSSAGRPGRLSCLKQSLESEVQVAAAAAEQAEAAAAAAAAAEAAARQKPRRWAAALLPVASHLCLAHGVVTPLSMPPPPSHTQAPSSEGWPV